jgi:hypothetical protein
MQDGDDNEYITMGKKSAYTMYFLFEISFKLWTKIGNTKKLEKEFVCAGYIEKTSVSNTKYSSSVCLPSVLLLSMH